MPAPSGEPVREESGGLKQDSIKSILTNTINTIEDNKTQIFEIYETARNEVENSKKQLAEIKEQARRTIDRVDELSRQEQHEKQHLVRVSGNFQDYSEEKIRASYEAVKNVQVELGIEREKEQNLRSQRDKLELRLRHLQVMLLQAEHLALAIGSVLSYLSSQVSGVVWKIEAVQKDKFVGARIIKAQEEERYRVSREIHDGPAQDLANLILQTSIAEKLIDYDSEEAKRTLQNLRGQIRDCLASIRQVIFDMRPMALDDLGLAPAINQLVGKLASREIVSTEFSVDGKRYDLPKHVEIAVFRIVQEALNNVAHHAGTDKARVRLLYTPEALSVLIEDAGKGFDMEEGLSPQMPEVEEVLASDGADHAGKFGIMGMQERAKIIGAELHIQSAPGKGTRVHLRIPNKITAAGQEHVKVVRTLDKGRR